MIMVNDITNKQDSVVISVMCSLVTSVVDWSEEK